MAVMLLKEFSMTQDRLFLKVMEVAALLGLSKRSLYRQLQDDRTFPKPRKIRGRTLFLAQEINEWAKTAGLSNQ